MIQKQWLKFQQLHDTNGIEDISGDNEFLAFDRDNNGDIDEIKAYHFMFGPRDLGGFRAGTSYDKSHHDFYLVKEKYFKKE